MLYASHFTDEERAETGACLRLLSTAFRFSPDAPEAGPLLDIVRDRLLAVAWPAGGAEQLEAIAARMAENLDPGELREAYQRLFIGPDAFEAPAWGSVYLDRESVLFGDSTLELRAFLAREGAALDTGVNEPEDHIGLVLWLASDFLLADNDEALAELIEQHVLPWSGRYCELLRIHAGHPFYEGLADLTALTLAALAQKMDLKRVTKTLYR